LFDNIITAGDIYTFYYTFASNVDFEYISVFFVDGSPEADYFTMLSPIIWLYHDGKANVEYSGLISIIVAKTASSADINANLFYMDIFSDTKITPSLTFTRFEIIKNN